MLAYVPFLDLCMCILCVAIIIAYSSIAIMTFKTVSKLYTNAL